MSRIIIVILIYHGHKHTKGSVPNINTKISFLSTLGRSVAITLKSSKQVLWLVGSHDCAPS
jgi:hypothetical protein